MNIIKKLLALFIIFSCISCLSDTIYFKDGRIVRNVDSVKELDNFFLVNINQRPYSYSKTKISKIVSDSGSVIYEYKLLTAEKYNDNAHTKYRFFVNNSQVAVAGWASGGYFRISHGHIPDGEYQQFFANGKLERIFPIKNNTLNGVSKVFYKSGKVARKGTFRDGYEDGVSKLYYKTGELKGKSDYKNGLKDGPTYLYYQSNGRIKAQMTFSRGKITGIQKMFYKNGTLATEVNFRNGQKDGPFKQYYPSGKLKISGNFRYGKLDGTVTNYYESGRVKNKKIFSNGRILKENHS